MPQVKIYHNPECGTSRNTLALIRNAGIEPEIIYYLEYPPSVGELTQMIKEAGLSVRQAIRVNVPSYTELGLEKDRFTDQELLNFMVAYPLLINRPFVVSPIGTRLARPSEVVLDILTELQRGAFSKEDGQQIIDDRGQRLK